jgi:hypothetical protein
MVGVATANGLHRHASFGIADGLADQPSWASSGISLFTRFRSQTSGA